MRIRFGRGLACGSRRSAGFSEVLVVGVGRVGQQRSGIAWIAGERLRDGCAQGQDGG